MVIHRASGCRLVVENRPGAGAIIAIDAVAMMAPEGHTLLMTTSGTVPHMVADQLNRSEGTQIQAVHYRGESPMWVDLASGQIQIAVGSYQSFATVASRGVKPIAVTGNYRSPKLPDVPTAQQQGAKGRLFALEGGLPLMAPASTP